MPSTPKGFPYPAATDPVSEGAAAIQALATAVDTFAGTEGIQGAVLTTGQIIGGTGFTVTKPQTGQYVVSFTAALPGNATPAIVPLGAGRNKIWYLTAFSPTGFTVQFNSPGGADADCDFIFHAHPMT